jgi:hypothetical protein
MPKNRLIVSIKGQGYIRPHRNVNILRSQEVRATAPIGMVEMTQCGGFFCHIERCQDWLNHFDSFICGLDAEVLCIG